MEPLFTNPDAQYNSEVIESYLQEIITMTSDLAKIALKKPHSGVGPGFLDFFEAWGGLTGSIVGGVLNRRKDKKNLEKVVYNGMTYEGLADKAVELTGKMVDAHIQIQKYIDNTNPYYYGIPNALMEKVYKFFEVWMAYSPRYSMETFKIDGVKYSLFSYYINKINKEFLRLDLDDETTATLSKHFDA